MRIVTTEKSASTTSFTGGEAVTAEQLKLINRFTRRELAAEEVYVFTVILCDNEVDRDGEQFPEASLEALGELFVGKTGVFDHNPKAENQSARIFETKLIRDGNGENSLGEPYISLKAWAYMVRCDKNADLILEIDAGIKKEVSVGCAVKEVLCSICGTNQKASPCSHRKGEAYDGEVCRHLLIDPTDAYEWSFVAVPAQKNAGVTKTKKYSRSENFTELSKLFAQKKEVVISEAELELLQKQYKELEALAEAGLAYLDTLRRDVVKLAALAEPALSSSVVESMAKKLNVTELSELQRSFGKIAAKSYPIEPQLGANQKMAETSECIANNQFRI